MSTGQARIPVANTGRLMRTDAALILSQWLSPSFPVGAFAYSHGLETAIQEGAVGSADTLECWLEDVLCAGTGRNDAILIAAAHGADPAPHGTVTVRQVDAVARAFAASSERVSESLKMGRAFAATVAASHAVDLPELTYPVAVGRAARLLGLPLEMTQMLYLQSFLSNLVSVAVRLVPLGQTEGQRTLARLGRLCAPVAAASRDRTLDDLAGAAFLSDIAAMRHESLRTRLFLS